MGPQKKSPHRPPAPGAWRWLHALALTAFLALGPRGSADWPQFRGSSSDDDEHPIHLPLTWSETNHVRWKTAVPGQGWSSPVIRREQIWMTTATADGRSLRALCFHAKTGRLIREVELFTPEALEPKNALNSFASPTPLLDDERVYCTFGAYGTACLSAKDGRILWKSAELKVDHAEGPGSSPILYRDLFILNCDGTDSRYVVALDKWTGRRVWRAERSAVINKAPGLKKAFCTPLVISWQGQDQLISPGAWRVSSYDPRDGRELWWADIPGFSNVPMPVFRHGLVYVCSGFFNAEIWAIRPDAHGEVSASQIVWKYKKQVSLKPSPLVVGDELYMVSDGGIATCLEARTGQEIWQERIGGEYSASPIAAGKRIYFFSQDGASVVLQASRQFQVLATNRLESGFMASPAIDGQALILRTKTHLYRIEAER
jgi:outer membrane protein assembly factor BamB